MNSTIQQLADLGQSVWLDYIDRPLLETDKLTNLIEQGLRGMTSNPSIFEKAIGSSNDYDQKILELKSSGKNTFEIYDALTIRDIQDAADKFLSTYELTNKLDGYVSLEINPLLAKKFEEQAAEGVRLFKVVNRPNVMIKVPATEEGLRVVEELIAEGINVNVTLIFSLTQYINTTKAYLKGLKRRVEKGESVFGVHSVASVFVSRIDGAIDKLLDEKGIAELKGKAAVANSRIIFDESKKIFDSDEFKGLKQKGANIQRVLWGSTSTKSPDYSDVKYVEELIFAPTVNTIPANTLEAFLLHGKAQLSQYNIKEEQSVVTQLKSHGIDIEQICQDLLRAGLKSFDDAFLSLQGSIEKKAQILVKS